MPVSLFCRVKQFCLARYRIAAVVGAGWWIAATAGCMTSEKSSYERHLSAVIDPGPAPNNDVIIAFGLDRGEAPTRAVAVVRD